MIDPIRKYKKKYEYQDILYDSKEEIYFRWLLDDIDFIDDIIYNCNNIALSEKTKLLKKHIYTPDFIINWTPNKGLKYTVEFDETLKRKDIKNKIVRQCNISYIEIKGAYTIYNNHREFALNQKWTYEKYGLFVQKVEIPRFFDSFFYPFRYHYTDTGNKRRKRKNENLEDW